jgi:hypothetical protein
MGKGLNKNTGTKLGFQMKQKIEIKNVAMLSFRRGWKLAHLLQEGHLYSAGRYLPHLQRKHKTTAGSLGPLPEHR